MKEMKKAALHNLGCKVNSYETEAMQEMLEKNGYEIVPFSDDADVYIVNTCTVTNIADRKSRQMLHKAKKRNPGAIVVAAGCYVQTIEAGKAVDPSIDIIIGNNKKQDLITILQEYESKCRTNIKNVKKEMIDINHTGEYEPLRLTKPGERIRVAVKVQDGCNQFCSYCIIPMVRGRVRSRRREEVVAEISALAANHYQEVVLTGIHLSSYGMDLEPEDNLLSLIQAVHEIDGIRRIRLGSLEPRIVTEAFVETLAGLPKFCPHFHLSLQSGCDSTLERMNRRYTSAEYLEKCNLIRTYFDHPAITTDVIVGFPGETEAEFLQTKAFIDQVNFYETHIFKYSRRAKTKAAGMPNQVPEAIKSIRSNELIQLGRIKQKAYESYFLGKTVEVLVEDKIIRDGREVQVGHTREYIKILVEDERDLHNCILNLQLTDKTQIIN